ncbi:hypothetical protein NM208_g11684 [Fusarium decemcellulare]|uniref:Uncharacterized protein n=1 Tax=Fusarium decemcellulare TaxID=57161 RepID=A0ACC1RRM5_9HYPO|nr:hypothetical protein NM208_g11684 [Fusarium decemcellulare]
MSSPLPMIALEEHVFTQFMWDKFGGGTKKGLSVRDLNVHLKLLDTGSARIADVDANSIQTQVLPQIPGHTSLKDMKKINDELNEIKHKYPELYQAFASLSLNDLTLRKTLRDTAEYYPLYAKAQELDVPLYFHPIYASPELKKVLFGGPYDEAIAI